MPDDTEGVESLRFTRLRLRNWRNFREADVPLQRRVFVVGPNASGKTNLLDACRFLGDIVSGGGFQSAVEKRGGLGSIRSFQTPPSGNVEIEVTIGEGDEDPEGRSRDWQYKLAFNETREGELRVEEETVRHRGELVLDRPSDSDVDDPELLTQTHLEQVNVNRDFRPVHRFFQGIRYHHPVPEIVRDPDRSRAKREDPYGGNFLHQVASTGEDLRSRRLALIQEALQAAVPYLRSLDFDEDETTETPHLKAEFARGQDEGRWMREEHFSAGTLRLIGLLWAVQDGKGPLLIEEPGLSLHSEIVRSIPQMLARLQRGMDRQIILSTHSTELLQDEGIGLDEVLLLVPTDEGTRIQPADSVSEAQALLDHGSTVADIAVARTRPGDARKLSLLEWEDR